jgi:endonuclease/exonuclease/phosphatase family metal-dependent hydrolase
MQSMIKPKFFTLFFLFTIVLLICFSCEKLATAFDNEEDAVQYEKEQKVAVSAPDSTVSVMTWNIRFGIGRGPWFGDACGSKVIYSKEEIMVNLRRLADKINLVKPDILMIQEGDVSSTRSAYVNQIQWLLDNTYFNYCVYGSEWKAQFIPSDGLGKMDETVAIFSRWPLKDSKRIQLSLRSDQSSIERYFYVRSCMVEARVEIPGFKSFYVVNVHASAFATDDTKQKHMIEFKTELDRIASAGFKFVAGGDLNTLPPGSTKTDFCLEDKCDWESYHNPGDNPMHKEGSDYTTETQWLVPMFTTYKSAISLSQYQNNPAQYFTHTTRPDHFWDRTLDYLFTNNSWKSGQSMVHQDFLPESDHAPLIGKLYLTKSN